MIKTSLAESKSIEDRGPMREARGWMPRLQMWLRWHFTFCVRCQMKQLVPFLSPVSTQPSQ